MAASKQDLISWFKRGVGLNATHMIVVCDTYEREDFPVYVSLAQDVHKVAEEYSGKNAQKIMEVYDLTMDMDVQMAQHRAFNY